MLAGQRAGGRWVFPASHGDRYTRFPEEQFRRAKKAAGLSGGPHVLRHSFASHFLQRCPDLFLLAQILGHSTTKVTELYSHLLPGHMDRAKNIVDIAPALKNVAKAMGEAPEKRKKRSSSR